MTCPPSRVHDIPEHLSLCVNTILQAASVIPEPIGRPWLLKWRYRIQCVRFFRHCSADSEIAIDRVDDRFYTTGPNLLLLRGAHHVRTG
jgi:hypothetical protein